MTVTCKAGHFAISAVLHFSTKSAFDMKLELHEKTTIQERDNNKKRIGQICPARYQYFSNFDPFQRNS